LCGSIPLLLSSVGRCVSVGFGATADLMRKEGMNETLSLGRRLQRLRQLKPNDYAGSEALPG